MRIGRRIDMLIDKALDAGDAMSTSERVLVAAAWILAMAALVGALVR